MGVVADALTALVLALSLAAGIWGAWCWWRRSTARSFWVLLRAVQAAVVVQVGWEAVQLVVGDHRADLHTLYVSLPLVVSLIAEQLRVTSAETILEQHELEDTQAVGRLPAAEQRAVVRAIVRREIGIMALSALVVVFLALRAAGTAHGF